MLRKGSVFVVLLSWCWPVVEICEVAQCVFEILVCIYYCTRVVVVVVVEFVAINVDLVEVRVVHEKV